MNARLLAVSGRDIALIFRRNARAKRMTLRMDQRDGTVVVGLPPRVTEAEGERFAARHVDWIAARLQAQPPRRPFVDGAEIPLLGIPHILRHQPQARRGVWRDDTVIYVSGDLDHLARRVHDFLKAEARRQIVPRAQDKAAQLGRKIAAISLRDTRSRWGSCTSRGDLSFSWRLVLAPEHVLDYVVAHEVAHLVEMNHSAAFWALVGKISQHSAEAKHWLKAHGAGLHRYGA